MFLRYKGLACVGEGMPGWVLYLCTFRMQERGWILSCIPWQCPLPWEMCHGPSPGTWQGKGRGDSCLAAFHGMRNSSLAPNSPEREQRGLLPRRKVSSLCKTHREMLPFPNSHLLGLPACEPRAGCCKVKHLLQVHPLPGGDTQDLLPGFAEVAQALRASRMLLLFGVYLLCSNYNQRSLTEGIPLLWLLGPPALRAICQDKSWEHRN